MSSNAFTEREQRVQEGAPGGAGGPLRPGEIAPSLLREDDAAVARVFGMIGAALVIFGGMALAFNLSGKPVQVGTGWSLLCLSLGLCGLLFHAAFDRDVQFRRFYLAVGFLALLAGIALDVMPWPVSGAQFHWGVPLIILALLFLLACLRNETEPLVRDVTGFAMLGAGGLMALVGLVGGNIRVQFLLPYGLVLALLGLLYVGAFVGTRGVSDDLGYFSGLGIIVVGLVVLLVALGRSLIGSGPSTYFMPSGFVLILLAFGYLAAGALFVSDAPLAVLTRRELGSFFYSPVAYLSLLAFGIMSWFNYMVFVSALIDASQGSSPLVEPIVRSYIFAIFPVITVIAVVPVLTMRLLSEEQRSGTLEVLLTAPVSESAVVLSKFLAAFATYLLMWLPFGLFLLAIPLSGGTPFDYRPLFSFLVALCVSGAGFIAVGLFFSSLTSSQIASFVLTAAGMIALTFVWFASQWVRADSAWETVLKHMSYLDLWLNTLEGKIVPRMLLFHLSLAALCLFLTVKVLESRKWR